MHTKETFSAIYHTQNTRTEPGRLQVIPSQPYVAPQVISGSIVVSRVNLAQRIRHVTDSINILRQMADHTVVTYSCHLAPLYYSNKITLI